MPDNPLESIGSLMGLLFQSHPWHGIAVGEDAPHVVNAYIEMVPSDTVKYELDKDSGVLKVDRPQIYSSSTPCLYGFVPRTYCGRRVAARCAERAGADGNVVGDGDPLDICVLTEKQLSHGGILLRAVPIGGIRMLDGNEADDKVVAVMYEDATYGAYTSINAVPDPILDRLRHYFMHYKQKPGEESKGRIVELYDRDEAHAVINDSRQDYRQMLEGVGGNLIGDLRE